MADHGRRSRLPDRTPPRRGNAVPAADPDGRPRRGRRRAWPGAAAAATDRPRGPIGVAAAGTTAAEFRARLAQTGATGEHFVAYGYLTSARRSCGRRPVRGRAAQNETDGPADGVRRGRTRTRRTLDQSVHSLDIEGTLTIYQRASPGASFADPGSFQVGTPVAQFALTLQDILTVFAPAKGLPTLNGDMQQTQAHASRRRGPAEEVRHAWARRRGSSRRASARWSIPSRSTRSWRWPATGRPTVTSPACARARADDRRCRRRRQGARRPDGRGAVDVALRGATTAEAVSRRSTAA